MFRVAVAVRAVHPDFLGAQALAECAQDANFVVDAVDPILARGVLLHHDVAPFWGDHPIQRGFVSGVIRPGVVPVGFEYLQRLDHRSMHGVVGLEAQDPQHRHQHAPIVVAVGGAQVGLHFAFEVKTGGLEFGYQRLQGFLRHHRIDDLLDDALWLIHRGLCHFE